MKFWIVETNQMDYRTPYKEVDFPDITEEMIELDDHLIILKKYLDKEDLNTFSSFYDFDEYREIYFKDNEIQDTNDELIEARKLLQEFYDNVPEFIMEDLFKKVGEFLGDNDE